MYYLSCFINNVNIAKYIVEYGTNKYLDISIQPTKLILRFSGESSNTYRYAFAALKAFFAISDNVHIYASQKYGRTINIFATDDDTCGIELLVTYNSNDLPRYSFIQIFYGLSLIEYDYCIAMICALLEYIHNNIPILSEVNFKETFYIEINEKLQIPLHSFSIAFNGKTLSVM